MTRLQKLKLLLGNTSMTDDLLNELLDEADEFYKDYTHQEETKDSIVIQIALYRCNMLGSEGLISESYSGMAFNYNTDLPQNIYKQLKPLRKVVFK